MKYVFATKPLLPYLAWPLHSLGISAELSDISSPPFDGDQYFSLHTARSATGQTSLTSITHHRRYRQRLVSAPATFLESTFAQSIMQKAQEQLAIQDWFGSATIRFNHNGEFFDLTRGVQRESIWTIDYSVTSAFENEVRAVHDLPLGDVSARTNNWMTIEFDAPRDLDMIHPYKHLMARNLRFKFHHYDSHIGVISLSDESVDLWEDLTHAVDYLEGVINE